ncbi:hypothetical protein [Hyphococcus sp.]|uniref:hypothetical protein n=1 Tax=Hyphococcus sp. TaxID=2038636 RepID=UPI0035C75DE8
MDRDFRKSAWSLLKIWVLVFLFIGLCVSIIQLWGTEVPIAYYPVIFMRAMLSLPVLALFFIVAILPIGVAYWRRRTSAEGELEKAE